MKINVSMGLDYGEFFIFWPFHAAVLYQKVYA